MVSVCYRWYRVARNSGIHTVQPNDREVVVVAFRRITDPDEAGEYYIAGLLWEKEEDRDIEPAHGWAPHSVTYTWERRLGYKEWSFYIQVED